jgi:hypothetical protein
MSDPGPVVGSDDPSVGVVIVAVPGIVVVIIIGGPKPVVGSSPLAQAATIGMKARRRDKSMRVTAEHASAPTAT